MTTWFQRLIGQVNVNSSHQEERETDCESHSQQQQQQVPPPQLTPSYLSRDELSEIMGGVHREAYNSSSPTPSPTSCSSSSPSSPFSSTELYIQTTPSVIISSPSPSSSSEIISSSLQHNACATGMLSSSSSVSPSSSITTTTAHNGDETTIAASTPRSTNTLSRTSSDSARLLSSHTTTNDREEEYHDGTNHRNEDKQSQMERKILQISSPATTPRSTANKLENERLPRRTSFDMRSQPSELKKYLEHIKEHGVVPPSCQEEQQRQQQQLNSDDHDDSTAGHIPNQLDLTSWHPQILHTRYLRILLVRHGESEANVNKALLTSMSDYTIPLSNRGIQQAHSAGGFIREYLNHVNQQFQNEWMDEHMKSPATQYSSFRQRVTQEREEEGDGEPFTSMGAHSFSWDDLNELYESYNDGETECGNALSQVKYSPSLSSFSRYRNQVDLSNPPKLKVALWTSPYKRARQTAEAILSECRGLIDTYRENVLLGEQQFGLFEGVPLDEIREKYPNEMEHFEKMIRFGGRFYARCPLGESRFDVATRVAQTFSQFLHDAQTKGIRDIIVVSHGVTIRAFVMMFMKYTPEWMEVEENPNNCSVRLLQGKHDRKYIYEGFPEGPRRKRRTSSKQQQHKHRHHNSSPATATTPIPSPSGDTCVNDVSSLDQERRQHMEEQTQIQQMQNIVLVKAQEQEEETATFVQHPQCE